MSDCTIGYNFSVSCNTRLKSRHKIQSHSICVSAKIHFDTFYSKQDIAVGIFHVRNNHFLSNQMFFDYPVASFSSTHSKTRQSDVIGCREHRIRDYGSIHIIDEYVKTLTKISLLVSSTYGTITFCPIRCFSITLSLLFHQHIRKHASRM